MVILDIALKDLNRSYRSGFAVGMMIIAPLLLTGLIYFIFGGAPNQVLIKVGLVNTDQVPSGVTLDHALGDDVHNLFFAQEAASWISPSDYADEASARIALNKGEIDLGVIIPKDFTMHFLAGAEDVQVQIISQPERRGTAQAVRNIVAAMLDGVAKNAFAVQGMDMQPDLAQSQFLIDKYQRWYADLQKTEGGALLAVSTANKNVTGNPLQDVIGPLMAGQMAFFAFFSGAYSMMSILREEEEGTLARLFTAPVKRSAILAGKIIAVFISVALQGGILIIAGHYAFDIHWGEPLAVFLALIGQVVAAVGLGVLLISLVKTAQQGGPVLGGGLTVLGMLGGLFTSGVDIPEALTKLAAFTPQGWVIKSWKITLSGQPLLEMVFPFAVLMMMGVVMFTIGVMMFRKRFA